MAPPAEITIPTTSLHTPTDKSKPYTLYNITLRLPLRTYVVQKRYSEFAALHGALTAAIGTPPPAPLPAKSWFKSTLTSPPSRRGPSPRPRGIPARHRRIPRPAASVNGGYGIPNRDAANAAAAQDPGTWLDLHGEMRRGFQEARRCLARRDAATENAVALEAGSAAKKALVKAGGRLGDGEIRRRKDLLAAARVDREDLEKLSSTISATAKALGKGAPSAVDKAMLVGAAASKARGRVLGAPLPETEQTRELDNQGVAVLQRQMMHEQDQDVEALGKVIRRQREMAEAIHREVEEQTEMLDHVNSQADVLAGKVGVAKNRVKGIS
ncbi:hypothetical protein CIB48_g2194 [Xylaria polymorpha]|nr:hypothetical protein CIB48_g2194 [Xylaria polymorpha]